MRKQLLISMTIAVTMALAGHGYALGAAAQPAQQQTLVQELMTLNGMRAQLALVAPVIEQQAAALAVNPDLPKRNRVAAAALLRQVFQPEALLQRVSQHLEANADPETLRAVLQFLRSPVGQRMTALEVEGTGEAAQAERAQWMAQLAAHPISDVRAQQVVALDEAASVTTTATEEVVLLSTAVAWVAAAARSATVRVDEQRLQAFQNRLRAKVRPKLKEEVLLSMLFTYREADEETFADYIAFYRSETGQAYRRFMDAAYLGALRDAAAGAAQRIRTQVAL